MQAIIFVVIAGLVVGVLLAAAWWIRALWCLAEAFIRKPMAIDLSGVHCDPDIPKEHPRVISADRIAAYRARRAAR